jgi:hypothetical protein
MTGEGVDGGGAMVFVSGHSPLLLQGPLNTWILPAPAFVRFKTIFYIEKE